MYIGAFGSFFWLFIIMGKKPNIKPIGSELLKEETKILYNLVESIKVPNKFLNAKIDARTKLYCEGKISEDEFFKYLDGTLNENWLGDVKNWVVEKVLKVLYTLLQQAAKIGSAAITKTISAIKYIFGKLNAFADKNPALWRAIIIGIILFIVLIVSAASAKAATTGNPVDPNIINAAIGKVQELGKLKGADGIMIQKAMAYLIDIRDGHQEISNELYSKKALDFANHTLNTIDSLKTASAKSAGADEQAQAAMSFIDYIKDYVKAGSEYVSAEVTKYGNDVDVKLQHK